MKKIFFIYIGSIVGLFAIDASFDCKKARTPVEKNICDNEILATQDKIMSRFYFKYKNSLSKEKQKKLHKEQKNWNKTRKICLLLEEDNPELIQGCLLEQYEKRIEIIVAKLKGKNFLSSLYDKSIALYKSEYVYTDKMEMKLGKGTNCTKDEISATKGLMTLYIYYYLLIDLDKNNKIKDGFLGFQSYRNTQFIEKFMRRIEKEKLEKYIELTIQNLNDKDLENIYNFFDYLNQAYFIFQKKLSNKLIEKWDKNTYFSPIDFKKEFFNTSADECFYYPYISKNFFVNDTEIDADNYTSMTMFLNTFWWRRYKDKTIDEVHELIEFTVKNLKEIR